VTPAVTATGASEVVAERGAEASLANGVALAAGGDEATADRLLRLALTGL
jgi:hypothetical protein